MSTLHDMTVAELAAGLKAKSFSAVEAAQHFLARAQADVTGSFLALNPEATLAQAKASDARIAAGTAGAGRLINMQAQHLRHALGVFAGA